MNEVFKRIDAGRTTPPIRLLGVVTGEPQPGPSGEQLRDWLLAVADQRSWEAFAVLFQHFAPRLKTFYMRGGTPAGQAEDLVQETMMSVWRKASTFDPARAAVATWIFTIARNLRIDQLRRQRDPASLPYEPEDAPPSQEDVLLWTESEARVRLALESLSDEQRTIVRLSYFSEKSQTEIADELGIPLGTVKSRTRLAMARLRALLEDQA